MTERIKQGFTLIEILVVISIVGILMALVLSSTASAQKTSRDGRRKADLEQIKSALEMCKSDTNSYPATLTPGGSITCGGSVYLQKVPADPSSFAYSYQPDGVTNTSYALCAHLEIGSGAVSPDCPANSCVSTCNYVVHNP